MMNLHEPNTRINEEMRMQQRFLMKFDQDMNQLTADDWEDFLYSFDTSKVISLIAYLKDMTTNEIQTVVNILRKNELKFNRKWKSLEETYVSYFISCNA